MSLSTIAVTNGKGGVGKTMLACALAQIADWALLDADPQCNAVGWSDDREGDPPVVVTQLVRLTADLRRYPQAVIDTPGAVVGNLSLAMNAADLIVIPTSDGRPELDVLPNTLALAQQSGKPTVVVLNKINPLSDVSSLAAGLTEALGVTVCPVVIRERVTHKRAMAAGRTAVELEPTSAAADEIRALWAWLQEVV